MGRDLIERRYLPLEGSFVKVSNKSLNRRMRLDASFCEKLLYIYNSISEVSPLCTSTGIASYGFRAFDIHVI